MKKTPETKTTEALKAKTLPALPPLSEAEKQEREQQIMAGTLKDRAAPLTTPPNWR